MPAVPCGSTGWNRNHNCSLLNSLFDVSASHLMQGFRRVMFLRSQVAKLFGVIAILVTSLYADQRPITLGLVIDGSNKEDRAPLQAYLTKAMGRPVFVVSSDSYRKTVAALASGSYDFASLGALVYVRAHAKYGVIPLVQRTSDLSYYSVFITGTGSSIHSLRDLHGKQFAFGDIDSTSAHLMAYRELKQAGINPETDLKYRYTGSHLATAAGSMKLDFKSPLTRKCLFPINLRAYFNGSLASIPVLPFPNLGEVHAGAGAKGDSLSLRSVRTERWRRVACAEWHAREGPGPTLSIARDAFGATWRDRDPGRGPATPVAGKHLC